MNDKGYWITIENGEHVFVEPGQSKEDAIKKFVEKQKERQRQQDKTVDELKSEVSHSISRSQKRRIIYQHEVTSDHSTYTFPTDMLVTLGKTEFRFSKPIACTNTITIVKPEDLREQSRISKNFGGYAFQWCKKAGNSFVEISGQTRKCQIHFYENPDGSIAGVKIVTQRRKNG